jgi:tetratricopeptide (TPR) repeat protein
MTLADVYADEGWHEDRCETLRRLDARFPGWPEVRFDLGDCLEQLKFFPQATALYHELQGALPNSITALQRLHWQAQGNEDFPAALGYARQMVAQWPHLRASWERLAETLRRAGRPDEAAEALRRSSTSPRRRPSGTRGSPSSTTRPAAGTTP